MERNYIRDITEIRSMMERSTKFLSLSGWAGIMAGIYASVGAAIARYIFHFNPDSFYQTGAPAHSISSHLNNIIFLAIVVLALSICTAVFLSQKKAHRKGEKLWNAATRRMLKQFAVPLVAGGLLMLIVLYQGFTGFIMPLSLLFYGIALYHAGQFTYKEVRSLGLVQIILGLLSTLFIAHALLFWTLGFGVFHIIYGIYMHYRYER